MKRFLLTVFLMTPILAVASVMYIFALGVNNPDKQVARVPHVGAGAGATGGANAIGELFAGHAATGETREAAAAAKANEVAAPQMVKPESLPQGFIIVVDDPAKLASLSSPIFIAGSFNGWSAGDTKFKLTPQSDMRWRIEFPQWKGGSEFNFKFTRGSWELEELKDDLTPPTNRALPLIDPSKLAPAEKPVLEFSVAKWADQKPDYKKPSDANDMYSPKQITGDYRRVQVAGAPFGPGIAQRELVVWLPPGYEAGVKAGKKFPVLYMFDGQNLFQKHPGVPDEWRVDETATELIKAGKIEPLVIVGIPNAGGARIREYMPTKALANVEPGANEYIAWLANEVVPKVQHTFAVETNPSRVGIGGSSLGAVIALEAINQHPELFSLALLESPALRAGNPEAWESWLGQIKNWPKRAFVGVGTRELANQEDGSPENKAYVESATGLQKRILAASGAQGSELKVDAGAVHNEGAWAKRLPQALIYLFPVQK
ncbi:MAG: alpha/beta hydrolase [Phycisphaerales bacterium]